MSAEIIDIANRVITARITGKLTQPELALLQKAAGELIKQHGKVRILVVTESFEGWQRGGSWGDLSFQLEHDAEIERMAIVGDRKWEDLTLVFAAKGLRKFPIEYFEPGELSRARAWLAETAQ